MWKFGALFFSVVNGIDVGFIRTDTDHFCQYDRIGVEWQAARVLESSLWVGLYDASSGVVGKEGEHGRPLHQWYGDAELGAIWNEEGGGEDEEGGKERRRECAETKAPPTAASAIQCDVGGPVCVVSVTHLGWDPSKQRVEVHFDQPTNTPEFGLSPSTGLESVARDDEGSGSTATAASAAAAAEKHGLNPLEGFLELSPTPRLFASLPYWETSRLLVVPVDLPSDQTAVAKAFEDRTATASVVVAAANAEESSSSALRTMKGSFTTRIGLEQRPARTFKLALHVPTQKPHGQGAGGSDGYVGATDGDGQVNTETVAGTSVVTETSTGGAAAATKAPALVTHWSAPFSVSLCQESGGGGAEEVVLHSLPPPPEEEEEKPSSTATSSSSAQGQEEKDGDKESIGGGNNHNTNNGGESDGSALTSPPSSPPPPSSPHVMPFWDPKGVFALTGSKPLVLPSSSLPLQGSRSWSFSGWLFLADGPNGQFRTLLFKGGGDGADSRTPSAWLHPDSMKLALRASMGEQKDLGADSIGELPLREWTHVAFTFTNRTHHADDAENEDIRSHPWGYGLFVNGVRDVEVNYPDPVLANRFDLRVGKDPERLGPRCLLAHPKLWAAALTPNQIRRNFEQESHAFQHGDDNDAGGGGGNRRRKRSRSSNRSNRLSPFPSLSAVAAVTISPPTSSPPSTAAAAAAAGAAGGGGGGGGTNGGVERGVATNPLLALHRKVEEGRGGGGGGGGQKGKKMVTLLEAVKGRGKHQPQHDGGGLLSPTLAERSGLFSFTTGHESHGEGKRGTSRSPFSLTATSFSETHESNDDDGGDGGGYDDDDDDDEDDHEDDDDDDDIEEQAAAAEAQFRLGVEALKACEGADVRLEAFECAAKLGHTGAAAAAAGLLLAGEEMIVSDELKRELSSDSSSSCSAPIAAGAGVGSSDSAATFSFFLSGYRSGSSSGGGGGGDSGGSGGALTSDGAQATARGLLYLQFASAVGGCAACARRFAVLTLSGLGAGAFAADDQLLLLNLAKEKEKAKVAKAQAGSDAGLSTRAAGTVSEVSLESSSEAGKSAAAAAAAAASATDTTLVAIASSMTTPSSPAPSSRSEGVSVDVRHCSPSLGAAAFDQSQCSSSSRSRLTNKKLKEGAAAVALLPPPPPPPPWSVTEVGVGLLHMAAAMDDGEAQLALAHRYKHGLGVETSSEASAFYFSAAAEKSATLFHTTGRQPANEVSNRLRDGEETKVANRERGGDDEELRLLVIQAEEQFHAPSMHQVAGLLYWGHRGFGRDQVRALRLWEGVARRGDAFDQGGVGGGGDDPFSSYTTNARVAAAGMYLKGEGCPEGLANQTRAVELYERAAASGSVAALNGLGYLYFQGQALSQDLGKAFGYFHEAATLGHDGDSMYNAGHCLANGFGTAEDHGQAVSWFEKAAFSFGHFDSIYEMGNRHLLGRHPRFAGKRNVAEAVRFLEPSANGGEWGVKVRQAFDAFLGHNPSRAFVLYCECSELGFEVAQSNAAYLLEKGFLGTNPARNLLLLSNPEDGGGDKKPNVGNKEDANVITGGGGDDGGAADGDDNAVATAETSKNIGHLQDRDVPGLWALHFHRRAAGLGNPESFTPIGDAFFYGVGVDSHSSSSSRPLTSPTFAEKKRKQQEQNSHGVGGSGGGGGGSGGGGGGSSQPNYEGALWWYSKAAQAGVAKGAYSLGYMYEWGLGAAASDTRAERHYRKASELLAAEAKAKQARGAGSGEGWWGKEGWYEEAVLACSLGALRVRRGARRLGLDFLLPPWML